MKMKRIANNVALQTIGYVISGFTNVYIYVRECGYQKRDIYRGLYFRHSGGYRQQQRVIDRAADRASPFGLPPHKEQSPVRAFEPCTGDFFVWFIPSAVRPTLPTARRFSL